MMKDLDMQEGDLLFTADAKSMYTNIDTGIALKIILEYLTKNEAKFGSYNTEALIAALHIVFRNNLFKFGDKHAKQIRETAMGKRPAPPWATTFYGIHESRDNGANGFLVKFVENLPFYKRYLDDIIGIWRCRGTRAENEKRWREFVSVVGDFHGLEWVFTKRSKNGVVFMDMLLSIKNCKVVSTLYEKSIPIAYRGRGGSQSRHQEGRSRAPSLPPPPLPS